VQRRHQKVIEESPSPFLDKNLRNRMGKAAIKATEAADYVNAGTIEFLVDAKGNFYFIEMNTRIQVEHAVTEEATGIDLIKEQIQIASGNKLGFAQKDISLSKHAIECRICAENPAKGFIPSPGLIGLYSAPGGHGVRVDSHVYGGYTVSPYYDSMISKVISYGRTRKIALDRMYRALSEYLIRGIDTNVEFLKAVLLDPAFRQGEATTSYIEDFLDRVPKDILDQASKDKPNE
jgi:acetyl-CoA carboxylase biotin carboxylase subunit